MLYYTTVVSLFSLEKIVAAMPVNAKGEEQVAITSRGLAQELRKRRCGASPTDRSVAKAVVALQSTGRSSQHHPVLAALWGAASVTAPHKAQQTLCRAFASSGITHQAHRFPFP